MMPPDLYASFLENIRAAGVGSRIREFKNTSQGAAELFSRQQVQADIIYIDGSHQYADVVADLDAYWPLVRPGGIMFGDDYVEWAHTVARAVNEFPHAKAVIDGNHWYMEKPL